jgi:hypothetical protein
MSDKIVIRGNGTGTLDTSPDVYTSLYGRYWHESEYACPTFARASQTYSVKRKLAEYQGKKPCPECAPVDS